jgi:hypothetical protein
MEKYSPNQCVPKFSTGSQSGLHSSSSNVGEALFRHHRLIDQCRCREDRHLLLSLMSYLPVFLTPLRSLRVLLLSLISKVITAQRIQSTLLQTLYRTRGAPQHGNLRRDCHHYRFRRHTHTPHYPVTHETRHRREGPASCKGGAASYICVRSSEMAL